MSTFADAECMSSVHSHNRDTSEHRKSTGETTERPSHGASLSRDPTHTASSGSVPKDDTELTLEERIAMFFEDTKSVHDEFAVSLLSDCSDERAGSCLEDEDTAPSIEGTESAVGEDTVPPRDEEEAAPASPVSRHSDFVDYLTPLRDPSEDTETRQEDDYSPLTATPSKEEECDAECTEDPSEEECDDVLQEPVHGDKSRGTLPQASSTPEHEPSSSSSGASPVAEIPREKRNPLDRLAPKAANTVRVPFVLISCSVKLFRGP